MTTESAQSQVPELIQSILGALHKIETRAPALTPERLDSTAETLRQADSALYELLDMLDELDEQ